MVEKLFRQIMEMIPGIDTSDPNLKDTPRRVAKMYEELFWGLDENKKPKITTFPITGSHPGMIGTGKIFFSSICAHHFLPFVGHAYCFYIPKTEIIGLSKFTRIVQYYSARPQIQETLVAQIADEIMDSCDCFACYVLLRATHGCMQCRGVRQEGAVMVTPAIRPVDDYGLPMGPFAEIAARDEALKLIGIEK